MGDTLTRHAADQQGHYRGPAGVVFTPDELLVIWADLTKMPTMENASVRAKCKNFLERREDCKPA